MKKIYLIIILIVNMLFITGCTINSNFYGIDRLMKYDIPKNYKPVINNVRDDDKNLISVHYTNNGVSAIYI